MPLPGSQLQQIQDALLDAHPTVDELRMLVRLELDQNLHAIAGGDNLRIIIFNLLTWAEQRNCLPDLIAAACRRNPANPALVQLAAASRGWFASAAPAPLRATAAPGPAAIDIFLSYSHHDLAAARRVQDLLRAGGLTTWLAEGLEPGTFDWEEAIAAAIHQAGALVVLLTPHAKASHWVKREISYALAHGKEVFPVLAEGDTASSVPLSLITAQWVDIRASLAPIHDNLLPALLHHLGRPAAPAAPSPSAAPEQPSRPGDAEQYAASGRRHHSQRDYARALADYTKAIELDPKNARYYNSRGASYYAQGNYARAIADKSKAIEFDPKNARYYRERGVTYHELGDYARAIADKSKAIELKPKNAPYYNSRGASYHAQGDYARAIADKSKAIDLDAKNARYYNSRGASYYAQGDYPGAIADYTKAIELDPKNAKYYESRATTHAAMGNKELADQDRATARGLASN